MRAIRVSRFGAPEVLALETVPDLKPGPGQVLVGIEAAGVNPVETYLRSGAYASKPSLPYTPGTDGAGVVLALGPDVKGLAQGERVYLWGGLTGTYAEQCLCTPDQLHPLPEHSSFAAGAALGIPYGTAYRALFQRGRALPGETVLVHGASGGVGIACAQFGKAAGLRVIGTAGTEAGRGLVLANGARHALDHLRPGHLDELMALTDGKGVDLIVEMLANVNLGRDLKALAPGGRVVVVGSRGTVDLDPRDAMIREASILGLLLFRATPAEIREIHAAIGAGLDSGTLRPVIGKEFSLADAVKAHEAVMRPGATGKIVLRMAS